LFGQISYDLPAEYSDPEENDVDIEAPPVALLPDEVDEVRGLVRSTLAGSRGPMQWSRFRLLFQVLEMSGARWFISINVTLWFVVIGLLLAFLTHWISPAAQGVVLVLWTLVFAMGHVPLLGGIWAGLVQSASGLRQMQTIAFFPIGTWEAAAVMLTVNLVRVLVYAPVAVLVVSAGIMINGANFPTAFARGIILGGFLAIAQPVLITGQFVHASRIHGFLTYLLVTLAVVVAMISGMALVGFIFSPYSTFAEALLIASGFVVLYLFSAALMWRYARRKFDVIK
jgi:hypothetical protein